MDEGVIFIRESGGRRRGYRCRQCPQACLPCFRGRRPLFVHPVRPLSIPLSHVHDTSCGVRIAAYISRCFHLSNIHEHV